MKSLIIGADSFAGKYLTDYLLECGQTVVKTSLIASRMRNSEMDIIDFDIRNEKCIIDIISTQKPDAIFCLAVVDSISYAWKHPDEVIDIHVKVALSLFEAVRKVDYRIPILVIGSGEEYGFLGYDVLPMNEQDKLNPQNIYGASKVCQNLLAQLYCRAYKMNILIARSFNEIGPGQTKQYVLSNLCYQITQMEKGKQEPVLHVGNINVARDFTDIRDTIKAYVDIMSKGQASEVYNVGSGKSRKIKEVIDILLNLTDIKPVIKIEEDRMRINDIPILEADISKIKQELGWYPKYSLNKTIQDMINYWRVIEA